MGNIDLSRFHSAHKYDYESALAEIKRGRKTSCWMWYIFPQIAGLGTSFTAEYYAIADVQEASAYLQDSVLGAHLLEISEALLELESNDALAVLGCPDNLKLRSCMTLFLEIAPENKVFKAVLDKYFGGKPDERTLRILKKQNV